MLSLFKRTREQSSELLVSQLLDEKTFYPAFEKDLNNCGYELIIESPFITRRRYQSLLPALQSLYNNSPGSPSYGLFCSGTVSSNCWWESANELNNVINYTEQTGDYTYAHDISTTFKHAGLEFPRKIGPFLDRYNDDYGWWALTWLNAYKLTGNPSYLQTAINIFKYIQPHWTTLQCKGGVFQFNGGPNAKGQPATKDAIANALYITLASRLYQATGNASEYLNGSSGAIAAANWFLNSGLIVPSGPEAGLVNDHLENPTPGASTNCIPQASQKSTYNQGEILNGLADLYQITHSQQYLNAAQKIAGAVLVDTNNSAPPLIDKNGILSETCQGGPYNCNLSTSQPFLQWKGPMIRGLYCLNAVALNQEYVHFFMLNTNALYVTYGVGKTKSPVGTPYGSLEYFGFLWDRYTTAQLGSATQGSALDVIEANLGGSQVMCYG